MACAIKYDRKALVNKNKIKGKIRCAERRATNAT